MASPTTHQLAELIVGIARMAQAVVEAAESQKPGFKGSHLAPTLDNIAKTRVTNRPLTLQELPARVLIQCMGRNGPNVEQVTRDLEALLGGSGAQAEAAAGGGQSLDMT
jgi:hypothetical protein